MPERKAICFIYAGLMRLLPSIVPRHMFRLKVIHDQNAGVVRISGLPDAVDKAVDLVRISLATKQPRRHQLVSISSALPVGTGEIYPFLGRVLPSLNTPCLALP